MCFKRWGWNQDKAPTYTPSPVSASNPPWMSSSGRPFSAGAHLWLRTGAAGLPSLSTHFPIHKVGVTVAAPIAHPLQVSWRCHPAAVPGRPQLSSLFIRRLMVWSPGSSGHPLCSSQVRAASGPLVASWCHARQLKPTGQEPLITRLSLHHPACHSPPLGQQRLAPTSLHPVT